MNFHVFHIFPLKYIQLYDIVCIRTLFLHLFHVFPFISHTSQHDFLLILGAIINSRVAGTP